MKSFFRLALLVLVIALLGTTILPVFARPSALTEDEYWTLVEDSRKTIVKLQKATDEEKQNELKQLAAQWEAVKEVELDGKHVPVNHLYLIQLMRATPPHLDLIDGQLFSILSVRREIPAGVFSSADIVSLNDILSRPQFEWAEGEATNPINEWFQNILTEIQRWLNKILGTTFDILNADVMTIILGVLLVVIFIFVFRTLVVDFSREAKMNGMDGEEEPLTSEAAFAKAQKLSKGGDYRAAVRYLYLSTLLIMDERGVMRYDRSKTNREYLRSVANSPELSKPLEEVIEVFDNVWYGYHELGEDSFKHYSDRVEELKEKKG